MSRFLLRLIRLYQIVLSPYLGADCRYHPTCSEYASQAITEHGPVRGLWLTAKRLARCHPWAAGGSDPVPPRAGQ
ncbi:membrane protein insertion efficiency factor YidD [Thiobacter aerophilum]|uniref:Putative membrane protein insertion efficiency factor n=1 Tax=Thiobacter aerophilum TaxID=3121275 RepID=A0ABV0EEU1_9BURK